MCQSHPTGYPTHQARVSCTFVLYTVVRNAVVKIFPTVRTHITKAMPCRPPRINIPLRLSQLQHHFLKPRSLSSQPIHAMDAKAKQQYFADSPPTVVRLEIKPHFEALSDQQKRYA